MQAQSAVTENVSKYSSSLNQEIMVYNTWLTYGLLSSVQERVYICLYYWLISMQAQSAVQEDIPKSKESTLKQEMTVWWL